MMPGRRYSDVSNLLAALMALGCLVCIFFIAWGTVVFAAAATWALFSHFLRMMGAA